MTALLRGELLKLRTTLTFAALVGAAVGLSLLLVVLTTSVESDFALHTLFAGDFTSFFILLLGAIGMTGEWRHRTITGTVLAAPDRLRLLAAKLLSHAAAGILLSLVVTLAIMLVGTLILSSRGEATLGVGGLADVLWRNLAIAAVLGPLGVCAGALLRNQGVTVVGVVIVAVALEPELLSAIPEVGRFGPLFAAPQGIIGSDGMEGLLAIAVALAWVAATFAAAGARLRRGDLV